MNGIMVTSDHDGEHVGDHDSRIDELVKFCSVARTRDEMMAFLSISSRSYFQRNILKPLLDAGKIKMTIPDKPKSKNQKYIMAE